MFREIKVLDVSDPAIPHDTRIELPHICPHCGKGMEAKPLTGYYIYSNIMPRLFVLFYCPICEMCFVGVYTASHDFNFSCSNVFEHTFPECKTATSFSEEILNLSPRFVTIYNQSETAENHGLSEICGLGYRKSLEFLVKDYAIYLHPDKESDIKIQPLAKCIENFIDNPKIQSTAKASAWLGNDEAHYIRKHENFDLKHLKAFIKATVSYVDSELSLITANELLNSPR